MTASSTSSQIIGPIYDPSCLTAELRKKAETALEASIRRDQGLGILAAGQVPWQILLTSFLQEPNLENGIGQFQLSEMAKKLRFGDRWLFAVQDAGFIQVELDSRFRITALGIEAVRRCLGD